MTNVYMATQPWLLPPVFMLERMSRCRHVAFLNEAQFDRHHVRPKFQLGKQATELTVSVHGSKRGPFRDLRVEPGDLVRRMQASIPHTYRKCPGYEEISPWLPALYDSMQSCVQLHALCYETFVWLGAWAGLSCIVHQAEHFGERPLDPSEWMAWIGEKVGADAYLTGRAGAEEYLKVEPFQRREITVYTQNLVHEHDMTVSSLDYLLTHGSVAFRAAINFNAGQGVHPETMSKWC